MMKMVVDGTMARIKMVDGTTEGMITTHSGDGLDTLILTN
jgi:hypothetical protein